MVGPPTSLSPRKALAISLALHELMTNASKYGALSVAKGLVSIAWNVSGPTFFFSWTETGGPPVVRPNRAGFGSKMIQRSLAAYFNGKAELIYDPSGLRFTLTAPVAELADDR